MIPQLTLLFENFGDLRTYLGELLVSLENNDLILDSW
jgi:hypothetical protein